MSIEPLHVLVGTWDITGRTAGSDHDDVAGRVTGELILNDTMVRLTGAMQAGDVTAESIELLWSNPDGDDFPAHTYSAFGPPLDYRWERHGDTLVHAGSGATYTGTISGDGALIEGRWQPDPGTPPRPGSDYTATMRKVG
jgi:hypothetical protein